MRVLLTGGTGFIGCYISGRLLELGWQPVALDLKPNGELLQDILSERSDEVSVVEGNILDQASLEAVIKDNKVDAIIHLAAFRNNDSQTNPKGAFNLNCTGTINVFEAARKLDISKVVYASSVAVLGPSSYYENLGLDPKNLPEEAPINPQNFYGATKAFNEFSGSQYNSIYGLETIGIRLAIIYGAGKKAGSLTSGITSIIDLPAVGKPIALPITSTYRLSFQHVTDAAEALVLPLTSDSIKCSLYNGGGNNVSFGEIADSVRRVIPEAEITFGDTEMPNKVATCIDSGKAFRDFGYKPMPLRDRIAIYIEELKGNQ